MNYLEALGVSLPIPRNCPVCETTNLHAVRAAELAGAVLYMCSNCYVHLSPDDERLAEAVVVADPVVEHLVRCPVCFTPSSEQTWWWTPYGSACGSACAKTLTDTLADTLADTRGDG